MLTAEQGFDLSHLNNIADVSRIGAAFIVHKATQGIGFIDDKYAERQTVALKAGVLWGAYHFGTASDVQAQSTHFLKVAGANTLLVLDLERNPDTSPQSEGTMSLLQSAEFIHVVHDLVGIYPVLYTSSTALGSAYEKAITASGQAMADEALKSLELCDLWVADYSIPPTIPSQWKTWRLQQYGQLQVDGVILDADRANFATLDELKAWWMTETVSAKLGTVDNPSVSGASAFNGDVANLPPETLIVITVDLQVAGTGLVPHEYAVRLREVKVTPDVVTAPPPTPIKMIVTTDILNTHISPSLGSAHGQQLKKGAILDVYPPMPKDKEIANGGKSYWWARIAPNDASGDGNLYLDADPAFIIAYVPPTP